LQIARIESLLGELQDLPDGAEGVPLSLIAQAQAGLRKAREVALSAPEPDPQPDVDRAVLERMYGSMDPNGRDPHR
jgi:hypothetical protein